MNSDSIAIEFREISKKFGSVQANNNISFKVDRGSIHALVGENGAGKSTAMKILFGLYKADHGEIFVNQQSVNFDNPSQAMSAGIGMVHQHFMLAGPLTALDNILLQQPGGFFEKLPRSQQKDQLDSLAKKYGFAIDLSQKVENLSVGEQQRIEILKILSQQADILILDEPTAVLTPQEVNDLFSNIRRLKNEGKTVIIITHKLKEVISLTDRVTVMRAGQVIATKLTRDTNINDLSELMVGRGLVKVQERKTSVEQDTQVLEVKNLSAQFGEQQIKNISFSVHKKEIVGIAGIEGNGQNVLIQTLLNPTSIEKNSLSGSISILGTIANRLNTSEIRNLGVGSFPEDRLRLGALSDRSVLENFLLGQHRLKSFVNGIFFRSKFIQQQARAAIEKYDVRPNYLNLSFAKLSGGNQQKLVVARELSQNPEFILAAQPTRGVDIGAIEFIHSELRTARDNGAGVLLISSELDELTTLSDRILVIFHGTIVAEFARQEFDEVALGAAMGGAR